MKSSDFSILALKKSTEKRLLGTEEPWWPKHVCQGQTTEDNKKSKVGIERAGRLRKSVRPFLRIHHTLESWRLSYLNITTSVLSATVGLYSQLQLSWRNEMKYVAIWRIRSFCALCVGASFREGTTWRVLVNLHKIKWIKKFSHDQRNGELLIHLFF